MHSIELNKNNIKEYSEKIIEEMNWLNNNKKYVKNDKELMKDNSINNGVGSKAAYVMKNAGRALLCLLQHFLFLCYAFLIYF